MPPGRPVVLRVGWILLALSSLGILAAPIVILRTAPALSTRAGRHTLAGALALIALALLEFALAVVPIRRGQRWAIAAAVIPFAVVGLPILLVDATYVAPARLWNTLAPQALGLALGIAALVLCAMGARGE